MIDTYAVCVAIGERLAAGEGLSPDWREAVAEMAAAGYAGESHQDMAAPVEWAMRLIDGGDVFPW